MNNTFHYGKRLRQLRTSRHMSQEELALTADVTTVYVSQIEREIQNPTVQMIERLCAAMGYTLADFFCPASTLSNLPDNYYVSQIAQLLQDKSQEEQEIYLQILKQIDSLQK